LRKKIIAHESDTHPGIASRVAIPFAHKVFTGFENVFPQGEAVGQVLSDDIFYDSTQQQAEQRNILIQTEFLEKYKKIPRHKTIVLVLG